jgi:hypothetical protein
LEKEERYKVRLEEKEEKGEKKIKYGRQKGGRKKGKENRGKWKAKIRKGERSKEEKRGKG